jgi:Outer membrane protein beta-barrel domain
MFKKSLILAGVIVSSSAFAQAEKFSGASIGINTGFNREAVEANITGRGTLQLSNANTPFDANLSYLFAVTPSATLGLGLNFDLVSNKVLDGSKNTFLNTGDISAKNHYSLNFEPGVALNDSLLGYFKLAYHSEKISGTSKSYSVNGVGYGFGSRYLIDKNLYLNLEIQSVTYNTITADGALLTPKSLNSTIGLGYKF